MRIERSIAYHCSLMQWLNRKIIRFLKMGLKEMKFPEPKISKNFEVEGKRSMQISDLLRQN